MHKMHLCSSKVIALYISCLSPDGNGAFVAFWKVGVLFSFKNVSNGLFLASQRSPQIEKIENSVVSSRLSLSICLFYFCPSKYNWWGLASRDVWSL